MLMASIMHNSLGYILGYWISRALGLDRDSCKTVALEVGLQNGGMASGLAGVMGKLATMGPGGGSLQSVDEYFGLVTW